MKNTFILLAAIALPSCAAPKTAVLEEVPKKQQPPAPAPAPVEKPATLADDGLRLPEDMLALPDDSQLRSTAPSEKSGTAPIIIRPPED